MSAPDGRPLILGYLRVDPGAAPEEVSRMRQSIAEFADREGFVLTEIFVETETTATSAFAALMDRLQHTEARAVIVPTLRHFAHLAGVSAAMKELVERQAGAQVLVIHPSLRSRP